MERRIEDYSVVLVQRFRDQRSDRMARIQSKAQQPRQRSVFTAMRARMASDAVRTAADRYRGKLSRFIGSLARNGIGNR
jgi:hypothetical protein